MSEQRPNIILMTVHDLGTRLGSYGYDSAPSPNLDALAAEGVRFERNFATATYCSPSRGSIITGKYPHVNGLMGLVNLGWDWDPSNTTLATALGNAGYETFLLGYQHEAREERVGDLGFQHVADRSIKRAADVAPLVAKFLAQRGASSDHPFYARVGFTEVHRSFDPYTPEDPAQVTLPGYVPDTPGAREDFAEYDGAIRHMDGAVGRILRALDEAGLSENTIVVFTTDHGSPMVGAKGTVYDPGINTTLLMRWPDGFGGERVLGELVSNVDLFPTLLEAAGAPIPTDIQGRSVLPLLQGRQYEPRDLVFAQKGTVEFDVRRCVRTKRFKYIRNYMPGPDLVLPDSETSLTRRDMGNQHLRPRPEVELYDLESDPTERTNLAGRPDFASIEQDLARRLRAIQEETSDPLLDGPIPRPADEKELLDRAYDRLIERCPYPRDGLLCGYHEQYARDWEFAEPRVTYCP
ncbi:MAG: sulfatase [Planctomycetota bacterium]